MISKYVFRPQVVVDGDDEDHIEELTQLVATPSRGDTLESIHRFAKATVTKIDDGELAWDSAAFEGYCRQFGNSLFTNQGLDEYLRADLQSEDLEINDLNIDDLKFVAYILLVEFHLESEDYSELKDLDGDFGDDFNGYSIYDYYRSRIYYHGDWPEDLQISIDHGHDAASNNDTNPNVLAHYSSVLLSSHRQGGDFDYRDDRTTGSSILDVAETYIRRCISREPDVPEYSFTLSEILLERDDFSTAKAAISDAIDKGRNILNYDTSWLLRFRSTIELEEQRNNLENTQQNINELNEQVSNISDELDDTVDDFRTQILQFIAFFAALITVATASIQIVQTTATFFEASRLILVFTGGMLIAFGGFGVLLPREFTWSFILRTTFIFIIGIFLISVGWGIIL